MSGVGEIRTPVQTSNSDAFYTFIFHFNCREKSGRKPPNFSVTFKVSIALKGVKLPRFILSVPLGGTP